MDNNGNNLPSDEPVARPWLWKPGISGNPLGSRNGKQPLSLLNVLRRKIEAQDTYHRRKRGTEPTGTVAERVIEELLDLAINCKVAKVKLMAIVTVLDRLEGKPVTPVAISPAELELVQRVRLAYDAVLKFAEANGLQMSPAEAVAWVAAREPRAREILADVITIDVEATTD